MIARPGTPVQHRLSAVPRRLNRCYRPRVKIADLDAVRVRRTALELLKEAPDGVRTTTIANDPRVADYHRELIETNATTYHSLVGKILAAFNRVTPVADAPDARKDMLWKLV